MRQVAPLTKPFSLIMLTLLVPLAGCSKAYYGALESIGIPKRDVMVHRVEKARDSQEEAKEQFQSALEQFSALTNFQGGDLEQTYKKLKNELDESEADAEDVRKRIADIEDVSGALFEEWENELDQYTSASLRRSSAAKLRDTRTQYKQLIAAMKKAESKMEPVLATFRDQVMYLKHNLNAQAIASLKTELKSIESDVARLVQSMESSINEANSFIESMGTK